MWFIAERDLWRLKSNWVFVIFACIVAVINYICVIPTNHQFIINPTAETLRITDEVSTLRVNEVLYIKQNSSVLSI